MELLFDIFGWIGAATTIIAYLLLSLKRIKMGKTYQILNFCGAFFMAVGLFPKNAWFSFFVQVVWGMIAVISLIKLYRKKKAKKKK